MLKIKETVSRTTVRDKGASHILGQIDLIGKGVEVTTGIHEREGSRFAYWRGAKESDTPVAQYAYFNEVGTTHIPARPAFKTALTANLEAYLQKTIIGMKSIYSGSGTIGRLIAKNQKLQKFWTESSIRAWTSPPNSPSTLRYKKSKKQGSSPLIASKTMMKSITSHYKFLGKSKNKLRSLIEKTDSSIKRRSKWL